MSKRVLVISDIHANLPALEAVIHHAGKVDEVWCLGDLVGYGPFPNECIQLIKDTPNITCMLGNHDAAALGQIEVEAFNTDARLSIRWAQQELTPANVDFLASLPEKMIIENTTLVHGSPRNPVWEYILDNHIAGLNFAHFDTPVCIVGHTHLPVMYCAEHPTQRTIPPYDTELNLTKKCLLNPGSVGQPRDRDNRAAYAIYQPALRKWEIRRVPYNIELTQKAILGAGLPYRHSIRLLEGW